MTGGKILIIEDNPLNLDLATDLLEACGFDIVQARTGEVGLQLARESAPDLVLMDISLPGMDGLSATRTLKADAATRHLTIVALTAHAMKGDAELAQDAGCDGYLTKPIDTRTFASAVANFIRSARTFSNQDTSS